MISLARAHLRLTLLAAALLGGLALWGLGAWLKRDVLPGVLRKQVSAALKREVDFARLDTNFYSKFSLSGIRVARGEKLKDGTLFSAGEVVVRYKLLQMILHPSRWMKAVRRIEVRGPSLTLDAREVFPELGAKKKEPRPQEAPLAIDPAIVPNAYMAISGGSFVLIRDGRESMKLKDVKANLNLRNYPRIEGGVWFTLLPETKVGANGFVNLSYRDFGGSLSLEKVDMGKLSELARYMDPELAYRLGGTLNAELEVKGGFMTFDELMTQTHGRGKIEVENGRLSLKGASLVEGMFVAGNLDERQVVLERLNARVLRGTLDAVGSLDELGLGRLRLKGKLERIPADALRNIAPALPGNLKGEITFEFSATGTGRKPVFTGRLLAPEFGLPDFMVREFVAEAVYGVNDVKLTNLKAKIWDGTIEGEGSVGNLKVGPPELSFRLKGAGLRLERSPIGSRYSGVAGMKADIEGTPRDLKGTAEVRVTGIKAQGRPIDDMAVDAVFEGSRVRIAARTSSGSVTASLPISLEGRPRCEGCLIDVQDSIPRLVALAGVEPPEGLEGRTSAAIRVEGDLTNPVVTAEAVASAVRLGKVSLGDVVRIPKVVVTRTAVTVPTESPATLSWDPERTVVSLSGSMPFTALRQAGSEGVAVHLECRNGNLGVLKRLGVARDAEGSLTLVVDGTGSASYPVWSMTLDGGGRRIVLREKVFSKDIEEWRLSARMVENEGSATAFVGIDKQGVNLKGVFSLTGWNLEAVAMALYTDARKKADYRGIPVAVPEVGDFRVKLKGRAYKEAGDARVTITGMEADQAAEIEISNGKLVYAGGEGTGSGKGGKEVAAGEPAAPSAVSRWVTQSLNVTAYLVIGKNVFYAPRTFEEKMLENLMKMWEGRDARKKVAKTYGTAGGVLSTGRDYMVGLNVKLRQSTEGSGRLKLRKVGRYVTMDGKLIIEPGGKVNVKLPPNLIETHEFVLVQDTGRAVQSLSRDQLIEFVREYIPEEGDSSLISSEGGEGLELKLDGRLSLVGETTLRDKVLQTDSGEMATVEELKVRIVLYPPSQSELADPNDKRLLKFDVKFISEPETVTGEVADMGAAGGAAGSTGAMPVTDGSAGASTMAMTRQVSIRPTQGALLAALTGLDVLSSGAAQGGAGTSMMDRAWDSMKTAWYGAIFSYALMPVKWGLEWMGIRLDQLAVKKSDIVTKKQAPPSAIAAAPGAAGNGMTGSQQMLADALSNSELTIGKSFGPEFYASAHFMLLDASGAMGARYSSDMTATRTNTWGGIYELEYRKSKYKLNTKYRGFGLPDDPQQLKPYELYGGVEVNQEFRGVGRRERFIW